MHVLEGIKLDFKDVLIVPQRSTISSRAVVDLRRKYSFIHADQEWEGIGIIASNMDTVGTFEMAKSLSRHGMLTALHKHYSVAELVDFFSDINLPLKNVMYTLGISENDYKKLQAVRKGLVERNVIKTFQQFPYFLHIDVANGYSEGFVKAIKEYRTNRSPESIILAGSVVTPNMAEELILAGADIAKIGIGSGSVCTTRIKAGVGYPQLSAIDECAFAVHSKSNGHVCSDGGITCPGDVAKAFAAGADFIMLGGMLAGTDECCGEWEYETEIIGTRVTGRVVKKLFKFYGMSSEEALCKYHGGVAKYRTAEGKAVKIPYKGPVEGVIQSILGGVRSACTYVGAEKLKDLPKCACFIRVGQTHNTVFE
jgi:GMP reductase